MKPVRREGEKERGGPGSMKLTSWFQSLSEVPRDILVSEILPPVSFQFELVLNRAFNLLMSVC